MTDEKIRYVLDVDDKGSPKLVKFGDSAKGAGKKAQTSFDKAGKSVKAFGDQLPGVSGALSRLAAGPAVMAGAAFAGLGIGLVSSIKGSIDLADKTGKLATRLGMTAEQVSVLSHYADLSGTNIDALATGMGRLGAKLASGDKDLAKMGITAKTTNEALFQVADRVKATEDPLLRLKIATDAFGKSGQNMIPLLVQGGDELRKMAGSANIVTTEMAKMSEKFNDDITRMKSQFASIGMGIAEKVLPELQRWLEGLDKIRQAMGLLNNEEKKNAERAAIIAKYADKQDANRAAGMAGAPAWLIEKTGANRIDGKTLSQALAEVDAKYTLPQIAAPAGGGTTSKPAGPAEPTGPAVEVDYSAIELESQKQSGEWMSSSLDAPTEPPDFYANIPLSDKAMASLEAQRAKADAIADAATQKQAEQIAGIAQSASSVLAGSFLKAGEGIDEVFSSIADGFANMLAQMVAELAANAVILGLLSMINPAAGASMAGNMGGLSGLVLGRATGGPVDGGAVMFNERREEAIIQRGPARVEPVASGGDTIIIQVQNPAQAASLQRELQSERRLGKRGIRR